MLTTYAIMSPQTPSPTQMKFMAIIVVTVPRTRTTGIKISSPIFGLDYVSRHMLNVIHCNESSNCFFCPNAAHVGAFQHHRSILIQSAGVIDMKSRTHPHLPPTYRCRVD